jgi:hypothetical protein
LKTLWSALNLASSLNLMTSEIWHDLCHRNSDAVLLNPEAANLRKSEDAHVTRPARKICREAACPPSPHSPFTHPLPDSALSGAIRRYSEFKLHSIIPSPQEPRLKNPKFLRFVPVKKTLNKIAAKPVFRLPDDPYYTGTACAAPRFVAAKLNYAR